VSPETAADASWGTLIASSATPVHSPDPFSVLWAVADQRENTIPMRLGRDRKRATAWGDPWENFGYAHVSKDHLGVGRDWLSPGLMTFWIQKTLRSPNGIYPDLKDSHNDRYIRCEEYRIFGLGIRLTTTVVVDMRRYADGLPLGVKTAYQNLENF
jgi:hypothetical protein